MHVMSNTWPSFTARDGLGYNIMKQLKCIDYGESIWSYFQVSWPEVIQLRTGESYDKFDAIASLCKSCSWS